MDYQTKEKKEYIDPCEVLEKKMNKLLENLSKETEINSLKLIGLKKNEECKEIMQCQGTLETIKISEKHIHIMSPIESNILIKFGTKHLT